MTRLRPYLLGLKFTVYTGCQALGYLNLYNTVEPQIERWFEILQAFDFDVGYRPGTRMTHIDVLNRDEYTEQIPSDLEEGVVAQWLKVCLTLTTDERVRLMQQGDRSTKDLI